MFIDVGQENYEDSINNQSIVLQLLPEWIARWV